MGPRLSDMKGSQTKPPLSVLPKSALVYGSRACQWGAHRYSLGNFHRPPPEGLTPERRLLVYLDAVLRHATAVSDALNRAIGTETDLTIAACDPDEDSGLPHLAHLLASSMLAITCAVNDGLIPDDPGAPWLEAPVPMDDLPLPSICEHGNGVYGPMCRTHKVNLGGSPSGVRFCRITGDIVQP